MMMAIKPKWTDAFSSPEDTHRSLELRYNDLVHSVTFSPEHRVTVFPTSGPEYWALSTPPRPDTHLLTIEEALQSLTELVTELLETPTLYAELSVIPGFEVHRPIPVVVEADASDQVVARWIEPQLVAIGPTEAEALAGLADVIGTVWRRFSSNRARLSENARRIRTVIEAYATPV